MKVTGIYPAQTYHPWVLLMLVALLAACSGSAPSESMGRSLLERQVETQSKGKIKLVGFTKTNGMGDQTAYQIAYEAEIEFLADGAWVSWGATGSAPSFEFSTQQVGSGAMMQLLGAVSGSSNVRQGQRTTINGTLLFRRTEKGWLGQHGKVY